MCIRDRLKPEHLGQITIELTQHGDKLGVVIYAENSKTVSLLAQHAGSLGVLMEDRTGQNVNIQVQQQEQQQQPQYDGHNQQQDVYKRQVSSSGPTFTDTNNSAVRYAASRGWISGYSDGSFRPYNGLARSEAASLMTRLLGRTSGGTTVYYRDVPTTYWAYRAIQLASSYV